MPSKAKTKTRTKAKTTLTRRQWDKDELKAIRSMARKESVAKIARTLRRTQGAIRQKAFSIGISLDTRGRKAAA